jgi:hypothetical protein
MLAAAVIRKSLHVSRKVCPIYAEISTFFDRSENRGDLQAEEGRITTVGIVSVK